MYQFRAGKMLAGVAAFGIALTITHPSHAAVVIAATGYDAGSRSGLATLNSSWLPVAVTAGRYNVTGYDIFTNTPFAYKTYAYDLATTLSGGTYTIKSLASTGLSVVKQAQLNALVANTASIATTADSSAAVQLAIWEIINEGSPSIYSLGGGDFSVSGGTISAARGLANTYLANVTGDIWKSDGTYSLGILSSGYKQDQIYWTVAPIQQPVPEPATWAMFIGGFGLIGGAMRWRRAHATARA